MKVSVNGEDQELECDMTVGSLVERLGLASRRVAVELNRSVVERDRWTATVLRERDQVEIVQFVGGG